jgi:predicted transposase/invertase (TIGR01784 family)
MDEQVQMMYEAREKARRDHEARIRLAERDGLKRGEARGIVKGVAQEKREMAKNLLALGIDTAIISAASGLSFADIQSLQQQ